MHNQEKEILVLNNNARELQDQNKKLESDKGMNE